MKSFTFYLAFALLFGSCIAQQGSKAVPVAEFEKEIAKPGIQLLDVRSAAEFKSGYISQAMQADWNSQAQFRERTQHLDKKKPVYVYCLSGARSAAAGAYLREQGFTQVVELKGGLLSWKAAGKPLTGLSAAKRLSLEDFNKQIATEGVVLVDVGAEWCPPCKKMAPVVKSLQADSDLHFSLLNVDGGTDTEIMKALNVEALPVFIVYKNGKQVWRHDGVIGKEELRKQLR